MLSSFLQVGKQSNFSDWFLIATDFFSLFKVLLIFYRLLQCLVNEKIQHLVHFFYCYCSLLRHRQCCSPYFRRFVLLFTMREFYFYPPIMAVIKHYVILSGMTGTVYLQEHKCHLPYTHLLADHLSRRNIATVFTFSNNVFSHCFLPVTQEESKTFLAILQFPSNISSIWTEYLAFLQMSSWKWSERMWHKPYYLLNWLKSALCQSYILFNFWTASPTFFK